MARRDNLRAMKLLLVGGGGREHAIAWRLSHENPGVTLIAAPGNPGMATLARCVPVAASDVTALLTLATQEAVDAVIVGPEAPLAAGLADACAARGIPVFGPTAAAAQLETSKAFAKAVMHAAGVPTARASMHTTVAGAREAARAFGAPVVIKASGLAAGKGVVVAMTLEDADTAIIAMLEDNVFGDAGAEVLVEEFMTGEELSLFVLTDGTTAVPLPAAQDHKRVGEGDTGPNTGGMGAYCPADAGDARYIWRDATLPIGIQHLLDLIVTPTLREMRHRGMPFRGLLYCGVMLTPTGPRVVEFNCRFGDPETQAVLPALAADAPLTRVMLQIARGEPIDPVPVFVPATPVVATVVAAAGYPGVPRTGDPIELPDVGPHRWLFHAGTSLRDGALVTSGGRVIAATASGETLADAQRESRALAASVAFAGAFFRRDIGWRALERGA
ncbi:MAG: phosphoribosylamine--glycine ligase [Gemmatimonadaceae bacterium]|nr:phosphoribosylamine--glycine ligase [Gemmatimonadaceae bacterium]